MNNRTYPDGITDLPHCIDIVGGWVICVYISNRSALIYFAYTKNGDDIGNRAISYRTQEYYSYE